MDEASEHHSLRIASQEVKIVFFRRNTAKSALSKKHKKNPRRRTRRGFRFHASIRRSGQEVFVDTTRDREVVLVLQRAASHRGVASLFQGRDRRSHSPARQLRGIEMLVQDLDAKVEALGYVILEPSRDRPHIPVVVAARSTDGT